MVIGIDGSRATVGQPTGTERYSIELLSAIDQLEPPEQIRVYLNTSAPPDGMRFPGVAVPLPGSRFWTLRHLSAEMRRSPPDVLFVPSHVIPPIHPVSVVTMHDLGYLVEPACHDPRHRRQLEWTTRWNCRASSGIIAVSETTRRDLIEWLDVPERRISVVHHGVSPAFTRARVEKIEAIRARYKLSDQCVLAVGTIHPRKNLIRLIEAFELLAETHQDLQLVLCGRPGWRADETIARMRSSPFTERIVHLGYIPDIEMPALYSAASVLAFPTLYEGFGLPALEAMRCGTPVVAAGRSALPEVCGDAAVLVDPLELGEIAGGIESVLTDQVLSDRLVQSGLARAKSFTWERCATQTLAFLRSIRDNSHR